MRMHSHVPEQLQFHLQISLNNYSSDTSQVVKNTPANAGDIRDVGSVPGGEDPLEEVMAVHSSVLAWRIPWTEEPGRL